MSISITPAVRAGVIKLFQQRFIFEIVHTFFQKQRRKQSAEDADCQKNPGTDEKNARKLPHNQKEYRKNQKNSALFRIFHALRPGGYTDDQCNSNQ